MGNATTRDLIERKWSEMEAGRTGRRPTIRNVHVAPAAKILAFVKDYLASEGVPPTIRAIAEYMGYQSPNSVVGHLKAMERKGLVKHRSGSRGWMPAVRGNAEAVAPHSSCPHCGKSLDREPGYRPPGLDAGEGRA